MSTLDRIAEAVLVSRYPHVPRQSPDGWLMVARQEWLTAKDEARTAIEAIRRPGPAAKPLEPWGGHGEPGYPGDNAIINQYIDAIIAEKL